MELWTVKEVSGKTRMSEAYWRKQIRLGTIPVTKVGRAVRLDSDAVRAFLDTRTRPGLSADAQGLRDEASAPLGSTPTARIVGGTGREPTGGRPRLESSRGFPARGVRP
jgi:excisionase family DNA binding protein